MAVVHIGMAASNSEYQQHKGDDKSRCALVAFQLDRFANSWRCYYSQPCLQGGKNCGLYPSYPINNSPFRHSFFFQLTSTTVSHIWFYNKWEAFAAILRRNVITSSLQCHLTNASIINLNKQCNNEGDASIILANRSAAFINKSAVLIKLERGS